MAKRLAEEIAIAVVARQFALGVFVVGDRCSKARLQTYFNATQ